VTPTQRETIIQRLAFQYYVRFPSDGVDEAFKYVEAFQLVADKRMAVAVAEESALVVKEPPTNQLPRGPY
jgi:hypothetical protein